jgi:hypothetical protein
MTSPITAAPAPSHHGTSRPSHAPSVAAAAKAIAHRSFMPAPREVGDAGGKDAVRHRHTAGT